MTYKSSTSIEMGFYRNLLWIGLLTLASVVLSGKFACATPFAALATLAALDVQRRDGLLLVAAVWVANQIVGFMFLNYPHEPQAYAWGVAIGAAAVAAYLGARWTLSIVVPFNALFAAVAAFAVGFVAYEAVLLAAGLALSGSGGFSAEIVQQIATINVVAFAVLLVVHRIAAAVGAIPRNRIEGSSAASAV